MTEPPQTPPEQPTNSTTSPPAIVSVDDSVNEPVNQSTNTPEDSQPGRARVLRFPTRQTENSDAVVPVRKAGRQTRLPGAAVRAGGATRSAWQSDRVARARAVTGYRVRKAPTDAARLAWFAARGHWRWALKAWTFFTYGDLRADARAARVIGDAEKRREAQELIRADARARWAKFAISLHRLFVTVGLLAVAGLVLWGLDAVMPRAQMWPWLARLYDVLATVAAVVNIAVPWLLLAVPVVAVVAGVYEGRDLTPGAGWLVSPDRNDTDSWVDERMISQALAHLGIAPLDKFFKDGGQLTYTTPARVDGDGTFAQVRLPMGATADMVADRRDRLAANLGRKKLETWPTEGPEAGLLDLWVADKGKLGRGAGPWPLLHGGEVDIFDGVPFGRSQRGTVLAAPLLERNYMIGGQPGQGKSSAGRTLALGAVLDPSVELRVFVFASNPDFDPFTPRLATYVKGDDDEAIEAGLGELRWLRDEVTRRGKLLERHSAAKVTRKLASTATGLHPMMVIFDECHEMFEHREYGKEAGPLAVRVVKKARKCGITCLFLTQSPTATSIPKDLTRNCSNGIAFAVADHVANDGLLGSGKYRAGIRATELRPGEDRGTAVTTGLSANRFELVNTFYIPFDEGNDQVTPVITRAMALLDGATPASDTNDAAADAVEPDHLADIHTALRGETRVRTQLVLRRLAEGNPELYGEWGFTDLAGALAEHGIAPGKYQGNKVVRAEDITTALTERDHEGDDEDAEAEGIA